ncbi:response regulator transcription factor [Pedobacter duraquae]|uniref:LuxR family two component transcriptional regulator n=1 Tax=Pedobacter duraquae TaxID=425511 RepID=A0A4R6ILJ2_9SPHI|nr:response regulator transcription factor [Pedobacter duraquae]TDO22957.1 LuxR family two component transcriptional regulator [Pedobacter duraquae]
MRIPHSLTVLIVEDQKLVRDGIRLILAESDFNNILVASNSEEALSIIERNDQIGIIVTDILMPGTDGIELSKAIIRLRPNMKIVVLSMLDDEQQIARSFAAGVKGFLLKTLNPEELIYCLHHVYLGGTYLHADLAMKFFYRIHPAATAGVDPVEISEREADVLALIAQGFTSTEISDKLFLSKRTIEGYRKTLMSKTGSKNTAGLIHYATANYLIRKPD